jgi:hypothetical protein
VVLKGSVTTGKVAKWLGIFQARVNHLADSNSLNLPRKSGETTETMEGSTKQLEQQTKTIFCF